MNHQDGRCASDAETVVVSATSANVSLVVSVWMFVHLNYMSPQLMLAWASVALGGVGLFAGVIAAWKARSDPLRWIGISLALCYWAGFAWVTLRY